MDHEDLAAALSRVHEAAKKHGGHIVHTSEIERADRELLARTKWLQEIIRGWYLLARPDIQPGDTSAWYANFWDFARIYLNEIYGTEYCLSAENSIDLHIGNPTIPKQVIVISKRGGGNPIDLPFDTSILVYPDPNNFPSERVVVRGLQIMPLSYALCKATPTYFQKNTTDIQIAFGLIKDPHELIYTITTHHFVRAAERIVGAYEALHQFETAELIRQALKKTGMSIKVVNPFEKPPLIDPTPFRSPYAARITHLWAALRPLVLQNFPSPPGMANDKAEYLHRLEEIYVRDAYNSLSIEGYHVNADLIERVRDHHWNPDQNPADHQERNTLAARGYYEAFLEVKKSIIRILTGENPGVVIEQELKNWFQKLFSPSMQAGILQPNEILGYRRHQVYIRGSRHVPLPREALFDAMEAFFTCLKKESHPAARAVLGHFMFVYIHPFMDGNGRLGRFIMNSMLASGGYPWTVVAVKNRAKYFHALEQVSVDHDIQQFTLFIAEEMKAH